MHISAIVSHMLQFGFQPPHARPQGRATPIGQPQRHTLAPRAIMTLDNRRLQLRVLCGSVWITRDGCPADTVLGVGDVFEQEPGARVLVQAFEAAELLIAAAGVRPHNA